MALRERIQEDMKAAMRSGDKDRLGVIRMILAAVKQREVDERIVLDDTQVLAVLEKMVKQRRDSISQFASGGRDDLVVRETAELAVVEGYLPAQLSAAELEAIIAEVVTATGAASVKDMGKVMAAVKSRVAGRADMGAVSARIKQKLSAA